MGNELEPSPWIWQDVAIDRRTILRVVKQAGTFLSRAQIIEGLNDRMDNFLNSSTNMVDDESLLDEELDHAVNAKALSYNNQTNTYNITTVGRKSIINTEEENDRLNLLSAYRDQITEYCNITTK